MARSFSCYHSIDAINCQWRILSIQLNRSSYVSSCPKQKYQQTSIPVNHHLTVIPATRAAMEPATTDIIYRMVKWTSPDLWLPTNYYAPMNRFQNHVVIYLANRPISGKTQDPCNHQPLFLPSVHASEQVATFALILFRPLSL